METESTSHREHGRKIKHSRSEYINGAEEQSNMSKRIYKSSMDLRSQVDCRHHQQRKKHSGNEDNSVGQIYDEQHHGAKRHFQLQHVDDVVLMREHPRVERTSRSCEVINIPIDRPTEEDRRKCSQAGSQGGGLLIKKTERGFDKPKLPPGRLLF